MRKLLLVLLLLAMVSAVQATPLVPSSQYVGNTDGAPWGEIGMKFQTGSTAKQVTMLGVIDTSNAFDATFNGDGLLSANTATLWDDATGTVFATATIPAGTGATLIDNYRYAAIDGGPVTLAADTNYIISMNSGAVLDHYLASTYVASSMNSYWVGSNPNTTWSLAYAGTAGSLPLWRPADPLFGWDASTQTYGCVNMIPEPVTMMLLGFGAIGALVRRKK